MGILIAPVCEHEDLFAIGFVDFPVSGFDDNGARHAALFLQSCVGMEPIRACLAEWKFVREGRARGDGRGGQMRDSVLIVRNEKSVPVQGRFFASETVVDMDACGVAFAETQSGAGHRSINGQSTHGGARWGEDLFCDIQIDLDDPASREGR